MAARSAAALAIARRYFSGPTGPMQWWRDQGFEDAHVTPREAGWSDSEQGEGHVWSDIDEVAYEDYDPEHELDARVAFIEWREGKRRRAAFRASRAAFEAQASARLALLLPSTQAAKAKAFEAQASARLALLLPSTQAAKAKASWAKAKADAVARAKSRAGRSSASSASSSPVGRGS